MVGTSRAWWLMSSGCCYTYFHTVKRECFNCYPLATSEACNNTRMVTCSHTLSSLAALRPLPHLYNTAPSQLTHRRCAQHTASFSCLGKDTVKLTHPELSCHLCHLRLVCPCVCVCVRESVTLGWECTVGGYCHHAQAGVYRQRHWAWFDHHRRDGENMTNVTVCVRESPPGRQAAFCLLHSRVGKTRRGHKQFKEYPKSRLRGRINSEAFSDTWPVKAPRSHLLCVPFLSDHTSAYGQKKKFFLEHLGNRQAH